MVAYSPTIYYKIPFTNWKWTMNHGPFNMKEHVFINIFAYLDARSSVGALHY